MTATDPHHGPAGEGPGGPAPASARQPTLVEQMGGPMGFVYSAVPVVATLAVAVVSGARFGVQQWLYVSDETGRLGVARAAMGWPLTILAALVVVRAWRRSSTRLLSSA